MSVKAMERKVQLPMQRRQAEFSPSTFDKEKRTIDLVWSMGSKGLRSSWTGNYYEALSMDAGSVRMSRLQSGNAPFLDAHDSWSTRSVIGVVVTAKIENGVGTATVRLCDPAQVENVDVRDTIRKIESGFLKNVSVGYNVYRYERQPLADGEDIPTYLATDWEPMEVSIVPIGFDESAVVRGTGASVSDCIFINNLPQERGKGGTQMNEEEKKKLEQERKAAEEKAAAEAKLAAERAANEARAAEKARQTTIRSLSEKLGLGEEFVTRMSESDHTIDQIREFAIEEKVKTQKDFRNANPVITAGGQDEKLTMREGMTDALLHRAKPNKFEVTEKGKQFRSMSLLRLAEEIVGPSSRFLSRSELATRAMSTSDFPIILNNTARKILRGEYEIQPQTFKLWCQPGTLPDYKETDVNQLGSFSDLDKIPEGAEYKFGNIGEGREKIKVAKYGKILPITEEVIVNDDLNAMSRLLTALGRAAARVESKLVYTDILLANPAMADTVALFHGDHGNLPTAATIPNGYAAARAALRKQKDLGGKDYLELDPGFLIVGPDKEEEALKVLNSTIVAAKVADVNVWRNSAQPVIEARITGNKWFLAAKNYDTIMYAYLEGMNGPEITEHPEYKNDVINIKVKHVFGAKAIDYRGLVYNPGA